MLVLAGLVLSSRFAFAQEASPGRDTTSAGRAAQTAFAVLKGLAGKWAGAVTTEPHNPDIEGRIEVTMRVASRGNVLEHEIAPGGVPEPTMIYVEGDRLTLVHYCEAGNRPRLVARQATEPKTVDFEFADISGEKTPVYLQQFVFTMVGADRHTEDWSFRLPDGGSLRAHFDLKRAARSAPRGHVPMRRP